MEFLEVPFNDMDWENLTLPHDWAFENGFSRYGAQREFGGYTMGGIGWYRCHLPDRSTRFLSSSRQDNALNINTIINNFLIGK